MNLLIVHNSLGLGGIETQLLQILPLLGKHDIEVDLLLVRGAANENIRQQFSRFANIACLRPWESLPLLQTRLVADRYDVMFCTGWRALLQGIRLRHRNGLRAVVTFGVYHPREFCLQGSPRYAAFLARLLGRFPARNAAFLLSEFAEVHGRTLGIDFSTSPVMSLGVDLRRYAGHKRAPDRRKIVCVARIVNFKTYLFHMADVMRSLADSGHDYEFHLYGYGDMEAQLKKKIADLDLRDRYFIHGRIEYSELPAVFADAFMSIGEGASLIESSAAGVPGLLAVESNSAATTYGFFHEQSDLNLGSVDNAKSTIPIRSDILRLADMTDEEYAAACDRSRNKAARFSIESVAERFAGFLSQAIQHDATLTRAELLLDAFESIRWGLMKKAGLPTPPGVRYMRGS